MKIPCSGVILSGGLCSRFGGENKALMPFEGKRMLDHVCSVFEAIFDEILLVTNEPQSYLDRNCNIVTDLLPIRSSLTGIHAGLFYAGNPYIFVTACDTPFLKKRLVETILNEADPKAELTVPETGAGFEPLCAVYAKKALKRIEEHVLQHRFQIIRIFRKDRIKKIPEALLRKADPELSSFFNINSQAALALAEDMAAKADPFH